MFKNFSLLRSSGLRFIDKNQAQNTDRKMERFYLTWSKTDLFCVASSLLNTAHFSYQNITENTNRSENLRHSGSPFYVRLNWNRAIAMRSAYGIMREQRVVSHKSCLNQAWISNNVFAVPYRAFALVLAENWMFSLWKSIMYSTIILFLYILWVLILKNQMCL